MNDLRLTKQNLQTINSANTKNQIRSIQVNSKKDSATKRESKGVNKKERDEALLTILTKKRNFD